MRAKPAAIRDLQEKAFRIASAVFRFAAFLDDDALSPALKRQAVRLVDSTATQEEEAVDNALRAIDHLACLGGEAGVIGGPDIEVLGQALQTYRADFAANLSSGTAPRLDLGTVLREKEKSLPAPTDKRSAAVSGNAAIASGNGENKKTVSGNPANGSGNAAIVSIEPKDDETPQQHEERKRLMLEKIRRSGNTRLKEIQDALPDVSERTLRYDLQKLVEEGKLERVGSGGAGSYYRAVPVSSPEPMPAISAPAGVASAASVTEPVLV